MTDDRELERQAAREKQAQLLREHFEQQQKADTEAQRAAVERQQAKAKKAVRKK